MVVYVHNMSQLLHDFDSTLLHLVASLAREVATQQLRL